MVPVARRVLGENDHLVLRMRSCYAATLCSPGSSLDDVREAVTMLKETERTARRVLGSEHPFVKRTVANSLRGALIALHALEKPSGSA
jgi:hypothetical protein